jgi:hypothetical protein
VLETDSKRYGKQLTPNCDIKTATLACIAAIILYNAFVGIKET